MADFIRRAVGRHLLVAAIVVMAVGYSTSTASAADSIVGAGGCILGQGGHVTRPAGSTITIRSGYSESNRGILSNFLGTQSTSISVNGGQPVDLSDAYSEPTLQPDGTWASFIIYPTGMLLANPGDSLTFSVVVSLAHRLAEPLYAYDFYTPGPPLLSGPGTVFSGTCTVTAV